MLYNSIEFLFFLTAIFVLHWYVFANGVRLQNVALLVSSYVFYGWLDCRLCVLLAFSTVSTYICGYQIFDTRDSTPRIAEIWAWMGVAVNVLTLVFFKYYNFFAESISTAALVFGIDVDVPTLHLIVPIGISFYSFMSISYVIDVFQRRVVFVPNLLTYATAISFFPQLLAGPIGRMPNMLPQFESKRHFDYNLAVDGCRQALYGFFKKIVVADMCATFTDDIFNHTGAFSGSTLAVGAIVYAVQIYADFSAYSDISIGIGKLFGIRLAQNFDFPYFASNIADFWRRWHISLTSWFRDYVYIPIGGNRCSRIKRIRNTFVVFILSGLWHGANWTFVVWGGLHALFFLPKVCMKGVGGKNSSCIKQFGGWVLTIGAVSSAWVFFRAESVKAACAFFRQIASLSFFSRPQGLSLMLWITIFMGYEWMARRREHGLKIQRLPRAVRTAIYFTLATLCISFQRRSGAFIYFQF